MAEVFDYLGYTIDVTDSGVCVDGMEFATIDDAFDWIDSTMISDDYSSADIPEEPMVEYQEYAVTYVKPRGYQSNTMYIIAADPDDAVRQVLDIIPAGSEIIDVN